MNNFTFLKDKDFEKERRYIGASDIPTIALLNLQYKTPLTLYREKIGEINSEFSGERALAGKELEPLILKWGLEKLNYNKSSINEFIISRLKDKNICIGFCSFTEARHPDYNFLVSHADLIESVNEYIIEAKSTGFFGGLRKNDIDKGYDKNDLSKNGIPASVFLQIQTQMLCYNINYCYVSALIDTGIHRLYGPIKADKKVQEKILAISERFWWHVENQKPPKPETWTDVCSLNPNLNEKNQKIIAGETEQEILNIKERAKKLRAQQTKIKKELDDLKNAVGLIIGENKFLMSSEGKKLATAFNIEKYQAKLKNIEKDYPDIFEKLKTEKLLNEIKYRDLRY